MGEVSIDATQNLLVKKREKEEEQTDQKQTNCGLPREMFVKVQAKDSMIAEYISSLKRKPRICTSIIGKMS